MEGKPYVMQIMFTKPAKRGFPETPCLRPCKVCTHIVRLEGLQNIGGAVVN